MKGNNWLTTFGSIVCFQLVEMCLAFFPVSNMIDGFIDLADDDNLKRVDFLFCNIPHYRLKRLRS